MHRVKQTGIRISDQLKERVRKYSEERGITMNDAITKAIEDLLESNFY